MTTTSWSGEAEGLPVREPVDPVGVLRRARQRRRWQLSALIVLLLISATAALLAGPMRISIRDLLGLLASWMGGEVAVDPVQRMVVESIRLPRIVLAVLIGSALGVSGAALQGLFRNPLADPGLIGISMGAALGAVSVIVLGARLATFLPAWTAPMLLPAAAFGGGLAATLLIYRISLHDGHPVVATMLLAGVAVNALAGSVMGFFVFLATDQQMRDLTFWNLGSLGGATWTKVLVTAPLVGLGMLVLPLASRALNALLLGEAEAGHLGFDIKRTKWLVILASAVAVGAAVAMAGVIGFVGLVVPHVVRLAAGPDHRFLLPASALLGASLMILADLVARCVVAPAELPIGILTALIGAPFFLWLLLRVKAAWQV